MVVEIDIIWWTIRELGEPLSVSLWGTGVFFCVGLCDSCVPRALNSLNILEHAHADDAGQIPRIFLAVKSLEGCWLLTVWNKDFLKRLPFLWARGLSLQQSYHYVQSAV